MTKHKNVLVLQHKDCPSTRALIVASRLAKQTTDLRIHVIDVQPVLTAFWDDLLDTDFHQQQKVLRVQQLKKLAEPFENDCKIICNVLTGRLMVQLVNYILENDIDLVVKVGGGKTGQSILSSLDQRMVRQFPADIAIVSANQSLSSHDDPSEVHVPNVVIALNPIDDEAENQMNIRLLQTGTVLADTFDLQLNVVSAVTPPSIQLAHNDEAMKACLQFETKAMNRGRECMERTLDSCQSSVKIANKVLEFTAAESLILKQVDELQPDFLVMGSVVRGWMSGLLVGSVTDRVSNELTCSLIAIRPNEAISTVAGRIKE